ncbi:hypothetical protein [Massilia sp. H6]|uniref:hypothetical protein n=1 Tax=Massilia sp. H6 TaxID=2970464 RepID=UPI002169AB8D|nr:hypothetical protein [Massilia sp. H6]UVW29556.1 hypothetical protein NRS07_05350 [Massilia sp. H6]
MQPYRIFLTLIFAGYGCAAAAEQSDSVGSTKLPAGAVLMCGEHVVGDASAKPIHIDWQAFGLHEDMDKVAQFYQVQFGQPTARDDIGRYTWRSKGAHSELIYAVQPSSTAGPWSGCSTDSSRFKTIVLISKGIWATKP